MSHITAAAEASARSTLWWRTMAPSRIMLPLKSLGALGGPRMLMSPSSSLGITAAAYAVAPSATYSG